jgi:3-deoxy-D-manno-octulosonate 8-phosphate phosphatase (KDO 8-P phosphatase)
MKYLERNIEFLLKKSAFSKEAFFTRYQINKMTDLTLEQIGEISQEFEYNVENLLLYPIYLNEQLNREIKLLILDVDGVMTDGGMYFSELGDQLKKYNTKDGMGIMKLTKNNFQVGIISSGFKANLIESRAQLLGIQHVYVGRDPKISILKNWCEKLSISMNQVAVIGDDINDLDIIQHSGFSACPSDAVLEVKRKVDVVLQRKGGEGCVREFIDAFLV